MRQEALEGRAVTAFEIIDGHTHLGYWHNFNIPWRTAADMVRVMDKVGVKSCISTAHAGISAEYRDGNTEVIEAMRAFPGRILGYCTINPNYPESELRDELNRCFDAGMTAIKYHPTCHRYPIDGDRYRVAWEFADRHGLVVLTHAESGGSLCSVAAAGRCAKAYPNTKVLIGHSGFGYDGARACFEVAKEVSNAYFDLAASTANLDLVEKLVEGVGADRTLFGTDLPFLDSRMQIGRLAFSSLTDDQLTLVLGANARRIFGL
ncbi:MAG: amidohydrolase family protein [Armatimonadetes bacterium]|jgi:predicted TIM-barrel fold metal-dependent hydrolase|nr:amidohydrolase family protein [Armatimonadota bacterium]